MDVTLRDGSYAINFQFSEHDTRKIGRVLEQSGIPFVEIGHGQGLNASNYKDYWKSIGGSFDGTDDLTLSDTVVGYYGDATGMTVQQFKDMRMDEIMSKILFEYCAPVQVSSPKLTINYKSGNKYNNAVEVGTLLPKSTDLTNTFTADVWKWQSAHIDKYSHAAKGDN